MVVQLLQCHAGNPIAVFSLPSARLIWLPTPSEAFGSHYPTVHHNSGAWGGWKGGSLSGCWEGGPGAVQAQKIPFTFFEKPVLAINQPRCKQELGYAGHRLEPILLISFFCLDKSYTIQIKAAPKLEGVHSLPLCKILLLI